MSIFFNQIQEEKNFFFNMHIIRLGCHGYIIKSICPFKSGCTRRSRFALDESKETLASEGLAWLLLCGQ